MKLVVAPDERALSHWAADWIQTHATPGKFLTLAVGSSVEGTYTELSHRDNSLAGTRVVTLDELHPLPADDPRSFGNRLRTLIGSRPGAIFERFDPATPDADLEAQRVERLVEESELGACVLGLGPNGHLAFNEPGEPVDATSRAVTLRRSTLRHLGGSSSIAPATGAMTLGLPVLLRAPSLLLIVLGDKQHALARLFLGTLTPQFPATLLRLHPHVTVACTARETTAIPPAYLALAQLAQHGVADAEIQEPVT